jgi:signal-transduction protein with cAMP-binding, CBS, and nucleotidyltransferase domain
MSELTDLKNEIESLNITRQRDILRILKQNDVCISENNNGSFINLTLLNNSTLTEIKGFMQYISDQDQTISELEAVKKTFETNYFNKDNKDKEDNNYNGVTSSQAL